jgi:hypothetical protein
MTDDLIDRAAVCKAIRDVMAAMEWPPTDGDAQIDAVLAAIAALPAQGVRVEAEPEAYLTIKDGKTRVVLAKFVDAIQNQNGWQHIPLYRAPTPAPVATDRVEAMRGAVYEKVGECLAGMTHREVSPAARQRIKRVLVAALQVQK